MASSSSIAPFHCRPPNTGVKLRSSNRAGFVSFNSLLGGVVALPHRCSVQPICSSPYGRDDGNANANPGAQ